MEELPFTEFESHPIETIDGFIGLTLREGRSLSRKLFYAGFCALPWLWFVNVWFFYPQLKRGKDVGDRELFQYVRASAIGFVVFSICFLPWTLTYLIGGEKLLGTSLWNRLSLSHMPNLF
mmetsp:Transcript_32177/g.44630  ORF Transcript_32177/g.44630 Transcript_32177/m.44630 type:complete len:120 (+) Transcript_32177:30-389(+)